MVFFKVKVNPGGWLFLLSISTITVRQLRHPYLAQESFPAACCYSTGKARINHPAFAATKL
jgi:hypothetical protein